MADEALLCARAAGDPWRVALALHARAVAARDMADLREHVEVAAAHLEGVGNVVVAVNLFAAAAYVALCESSDADAVEYVRRATHTSWEVDDPALRMLLKGNTGLAALLTGEVDTARDAFGEELELCRERAVLPVASEALAHWPPWRPVLVSRSARRGCAAPQRATVTASRATVWTSGCTSRSSLRHVHGWCRDVGWRRPSRRRDDLRRGDRRWAGRRGPLVARAGCRPVGRHPVSGTAVRRRSAAGAAGACGRC